MNTRTSPIERKHPMRRTISAVFAVALVALALAGCMGDEPAPAPAEATPLLARLRIIFPEGFTRREMADRVEAVREIAIDKRGVTPRLTKTGYLEASGAAVPPAESRGDLSPQAAAGSDFAASEVTPLNAFFLSAVAADTPPRM